MLKNKIKALRNKKGFTLIELIVVIAVLGILVLLAAPRFLGYTADANVAAMKADIKVLENAALVYSVDQEANGGTPGDLPVTAASLGTDGIFGTTDDVTTSLIVDGKTFELYELDETKLQVKNIKDEAKSPAAPYSKYGITKDGEVFHKTGVKDKDGNTHFGLNAKVTATP